MLPGVQAACAVHLRGLPLNSRGLLPLSSVLQERRDIPAPLCQSLLRNHGFCRLVCARGGAGECHGVLRILSVLWRRARIFSRCFWFRWQFVIQGERCRILFAGLLLQRKKFRRGT